MLLDLDKDDKSNPEPDRQSIGRRSQHSWPGKASPAPHPSIDESMVMGCPPLTTSNSRSGYALAKLFEPARLLVFSHLPPYTRSPSITSFDLGFTSSQAPPPRTSSVDHQLVFPTTNGVLLHARQCRFRRTSRALTGLQQCDHHSGGHNQHRSRICRPVEHPDPGQHRRNALRNRALVGNDLDRACAPLPACCVSLGVFRQITRLLGCAKCFPHNLRRAGVRVCPPRSQPRSQTVSTTFARPSPVETRQH